MAERRYLVDINLNKNQLINAKLQNAAIAPSGLGSNDEGLFYWNTSDKNLWIWDGTQFVDSTYTHPDHTGHVISDGDGATQIQPNVVSNSMLAQMSSQTIKGRITSGTGNVENLSASDVRAIINVEDGAEVNVETNLNITDTTSTSITIQPTTGDVPSLSGSTVTLDSATTTLAGLMSADDKVKLNSIEENADVTDSTNVNDAGAVMEIDYDQYSILVANTNDTPTTLVIPDNSVVGRLTGNITTLVIDSDLSDVSVNHNTLPTAKSVKEYVDGLVTPTGHYHYSLSQPDGTNPFVYTDNSGALHIDGDIIQEGSTYETHAEQLYTTQDLIYLRDGATTGLGAGEYTGLVATLYDGITNGRLIFDSNGVARVGDQGDEQPLTTRVETPITDGLVAYWEASTSGLNFKALTYADISDLDDWSGSTSINTVGTITTGVWNGSVISPAYGGTGINNGSRTLTINSNSGTLDFTGSSYVLTINDNSSISGVNTGDQTITLSGDVTTGAMTDGTYTATLSNSGVTAGDYNHVVVDAKGRVTSGTTEAYPTKVGFDINGDDTTSSFTITHNLDTTDIVTSIIDTSTGAKVEVEEIITDANTLTVNFNVPPDSGSIYRVVIIG